mgnify:CR=1 FL=1
MQNLIRDLIRDVPGALGTLQDVDQLNSVLDALVEYRRQLGMSQTEVGRRMGVTQPTVSAFEAEGSNPRVETLQRYARAIGARLVLSVERPPAAYRIPVRSRSAEWASMSGRGGWRQPARTWAPAPAGR